MPGLLVDLVTIGVFLVGAVAGCYYRGWKERADVLEEVRRGNSGASLRKGGGDRRR